RLVLPAFFILVPLGLAGRYRGEAHLLGLPRRNLVVRDRHSEDRLRHLFDGDQLPGTTVGRGEKPGVIVKAVIAATEHEQIETRARDAVDAGSWNDDDRRG